MQLKIRIKLDKELILPINYNSIIQAIIYHAATSIDKDFTSKLHDEGFCLSENDSTNFKYFSFSKLMGNYEIIGKSIKFTNEIFFEVRSIDAYFIHIVYEGIIKNKINFKGQYFKPILKLENKIIKDNSIYIKMISPIIAPKKLENGKKAYLNPMNNEFVPYLKNNFAHKYYNYYNNHADNIEIEYTNVTSKDKCVTSFKNIFVTGWYGTYYLEGKPEYLTFLYNVGLGSKNSQGFGLFEVIDN